MSTSNTSVMSRLIGLRGVRTHNLKRIDVDLPLNKLIAVTGVSGAGKSSLAFDTIYAEGQRRYVETFSPYARQFLDKLDKPDADRIDGIPPAIAVHRRLGRHSPRNTVGTIAEIHELLAFLFARAGEVRCRSCGRPVQAATPLSVASAIDLWPEGTRYQIAFPLEIRAETDQPALLRSLQANGFTRIRIDSQAVTLDDPELALPAQGTVDVIVDRLVRGNDAPERRIDSIETAFFRGMGRCRIIAGDETQTFVRGWRCGWCGTDHNKPEPNLFRYNSPLGACPTCEGTGRTLEFDQSRVIPDPTRTIRQGALAPWASATYRPFLDELIADSRKLAIPVDVPFDSLSDEQRQRLFEGAPDTRFRGIQGFFRDLEDRAYKPSVRSFLGRWRSQQPCPACHGARLRPEALAVKLGGLDLASVCAMTIRDVHSFVATLSGRDRPSSSDRVLAQLESRLSYLQAIGLEYLTLDRGARTLSMGEVQRVILTRALGSGLVNTLYVLDEPTVGLHSHEVGKLILSIERLRDLGNTVVAVTHDHSLIRPADHVVDLGPGAGDAGGEVLFSGGLAAFYEAVGSPTSDFLTGRKAIAHSTGSRRNTSNVLLLEGASGNNLKSIDVAFPLGVLCVVTGVSGSGKSTLIDETLFPALKQRLTGQPAAAAAHSGLSGGTDVEHVVFLDQSPLARSARSNPVTYLKAFDEIRKTFAATHDARLRNYDAGSFSFNVEGGRCNHCQGAGFLTVDMQFLPDVLIRCPECRGTHYRPEVLEITYRGRNIAEVLDLTVRESFGFFRHRRKVQARLRPLLDIGLEYLKLGQPVATLSGGEGQRLKLANFLGRSLAAISRAGKPSHSLFLLDEPTAGLHPSDVGKLIEALNALVDRGHSVIVIEHSPEIMMSADWIIDLGPGAGDQGGQVVAQGTLETVARSGTLTGDVLAGSLAR